MARLCALDGCPGLLVLCQRDRERRFRFLDPDFKGRTVKRSKRFADPNAGIVVGRQSGDLTRELRADLDSVNCFERSGSGDILNNIVAGDADIAQIVMIPDCGDPAIRSPQGIRKGNRKTSQCCTQQKASREAQFISRANDYLAASSCAVLHVENTLAPFFCRCRRRRDQAREPERGRAASGAIRSDRCRLD